MRVTLCLTRHEYQLLSDCLSNAKTKPGKLHFISRAVQEVSLRGSTLFLGRLNAQALLTMPRLPSNPLVLLSTKADFLAACKQQQLFQQNLKALLAVPRLPSNLLALLTTKADFLAACKQQQPFPQNLKALLAVPRLPSSPLALVSTKADLLAACMYKLPFQQNTCLADINMQTLAV